MECVCLYCWEVDKVLALLFTIIWDPYSHLVKLRMAHMHSSALV